MMISRYVRMSPAERFNHLADLLRPLITKEVRCRIPISVEERLAVTLRYLATRNSQRDLAFSFKFGRSTINQIITEVCTSSWDVLSEYVSPLLYLKTGKEFQMTSVKFGICLIALVRQTETRLYPETVPYRNTVAQLQGIF